MSWLCAKKWMMILILQEHMNNNLIQKNIPDGWQILPLSDLCNNLDNRRIPITKSVRVSGNIPYYGATGIIDYVGDYIFNEEILLVGEDGADWLPFVNKSFIVKGKSWVNNHAHVLKAKEFSSNKYLEQYLNWINLDIYTTGGTRKKLNKEVLMELPVCLPKLKLEQEKIAEILSKVDEDIEKTEEVIKETERLKNGLMQEILTKDIIHTQFKKTEFGEIPLEWDISTLGKVADFENGKAHENSISDDGKYIVVNSKFISSDGKIAKYSDKNLSPLKTGEIVMVMSDIPNGKALGKCFLILENNKYTLNQRICLLRPKNGDSKFFYYFLNRNKYFLNFNNGTSQTNLRRDEVLNCPFLVPPKPEQEKIAEILSAVDEKISINKKLKEKLTQLKKGLMSDLLSGKVRVNI